MTNTQGRVDLTRRVISNGCAAMKLGLDLDTGRLMPLLHLTDTQGWEHVIELTSQECLDIARDLIAMSNWDVDDFETRRLELEFINS